MNTEDRLNSVLEFEAALWIGIFRVLTVIFSFVSFGLLVHALYHRGYVLALAYFFGLRFFLYAYQYDFEKHKEQKQNQLDDA